MRKVLVLIRTALILTALSAPDCDADPNTPTQSLGTSDMSGQTMSGTVQSVETGLGEIRIKGERGEIKTFKVSGATMTGINGETIDISKIKTGDIVTLVIGTDSEAVALTVTKTAGK